MGALEEGVFRINTANKKIQQNLNSQGYAILQGQENNNPLWSDVLQQSQNELHDFQQSWQNLHADNFLNDGGHYRYRRYSVFTWNKAKPLTLLPHEPHFQSTYRNSMNGGIYRDFEPFESSTVNNPVLSNIINWCAQTISSQQESSWRIQAHQFRIQANSEESGKPTPEGIHKDGADFILIMLLERNNIKGGVSHIYDEEKKLQFGAVLEEMGDSVMLDDRKVWHGVSEIYALDEEKPGYRDVLVLTFHKKVLG